MLSRMTGLNGTIAIGDDLEGGQGGCSGVGEIHLQTAGEMLEKQLVAAGGCVSRHREDNIVTVTVEVDGKTVQCHSARRAAVLHSHIVSVAGGRSRIDGGQSSLERHRGVGDIEAVVVAGNGVHIAIEIDGFACNPSGAVHVGRVNPHLADARHVLGKDADAAVVLLAADGKLLGSCVFVKEAEEASMCVIPKEAQSAAEPSGWTEENCRPVMSTTCCPPIVLTEMTCSAL